MYSLIRPDSASSAAELIFGTRVDLCGRVLRVRAGLSPGCRLGFAVPGFRVRALRPVIRHRGEFMEARRRRRQRWLAGIAAVVVTGAVVTVSAVT